MNRFANYYKKIFSQEYIDRTISGQDREVEQNSETTSQFGLQAATRLHEAGIASNRESECRGEYVPGSCTHRPSHHGSL